MIGKRIIKYYRIKKSCIRIKSLAKKADHIYLATDLDREGEAIAWHLREVIGGDDDRFSRVVFNEITKMLFKKRLRSRII
ncbi:DNA topoisomerase I [Actinobacillus equuli]|nr:DNA topoisomerase I [Actinobacillus equuli]